MQLCIQEDTNTNTITSDTSPFKLLLESEGYSHQSYIHQIQGTHLSSNSSFLQSMYMCASNLDAPLETNKDKKCILLQIPTIRQNLGLVPSFLIRCRLCNMFNVQCNMYNIKTKCIWSKFPQSNKSMNGLAGNLLLWVQSPTSSSSTLGCILPAFKENCGLDN